MARSVEPAAPYVVDWKLEEAEAGIERFTAWLRAAGVKYEPPAELTKLLASVRQLQGSARHSPLEMFEEQLMLTADKQLTAAGDARRMLREVGEVRRWRLLSPQEAASARAAGLQLETAGANFRRAMWGLATIPVAIGVYVGTTHVLRAQGVDETFAWVAALAAWFIFRQTLNHTVLKRR